MSKAQAAATSNRKSSFSAAALVTTKDTLTFRLHPKQLVAFRSKATEILYRGAAPGGKPHLMRPPRAGCYPSTWPGADCKTWAHRYAPWRSLRRKSRNALSAG